MTERGASLDERASNRALVNTRISTSQQRKEHTMIGSDTTFRDEWLEGAARAFFVCAYADYVEEGNSTDNDLTDDERKARLSLPRARNGENWSSIAPENPPAAYALAGELWAKLEHVNSCSMYVLANRAAIADDRCPTCGAVPTTYTEDAECDTCEGRGYLSGVDPDEFGHYLAMQAMGSGSSWFDDHEKFEIEIPSVECSQCTFSEEAYKQ